MCCCKNNASRIPLFPMFPSSTGPIICMGDESRFLMLPPCVSMDPVKCRLGLARRMGGTLLKQN